MMRKVLNVGGNSKAIGLPAQYNGWEHVLLDIDPRGKPDVVCDARELTSLAGATYDSVYCSHNLEHYYRHDVGKVLAGFLHVLKPEGFVFARVPDIGMVMRVVGYTGHIVYDRSKPDGTPRKLMDSGQLRAMGWQPRTDLEEGITRLYQDFLARFAA